MLRTLARCAIALAALAAAYAPRCFAADAAEPINIVVEPEAPAPTPRPQRPVVALVTDFGSANEAVGECHGAILAVDTNIAIVDLSNSVKAFDIEQGSRILGKAVRFPEGTVFVGVIDPGVGTARRPVAIRTRFGYYYVAPDNGLLTEVLREQGAETAVILDPKKINPRWQPGTFDGRDLFSPAGAKLAYSHGDLEALGEEIDPASLIKLKPAPAQVDAAARAIRGMYDRTDEPYGNIWTNIEAKDLAAAGLKMGDLLKVETAGTARTLPWKQSFGDVPEGEPLAYLNSEGRLAFAINLGDCRASWGAPEKSPIVVSPAAASPLPTPDAAAAPEK